MNEDNEYFFEFFQERIEFVKEHCLDRIEGKILLCSYIDSLSGYVYGGSSNFNRFRMFLVDCTNHSDNWRKVSLILLRQYVEKKNMSIYQQLINVLNRLQASNQAFLNLNHNPDVSLETLMEKCIEQMSPETVQMLSQEIKRFEYTAILWNAYRNASVHETAVQLNEAMNLAGHSIPYYSNENILDLETNATRFAIPASFLVLSIESGLAYMKRKIQLGELNLTLSKPYDEPTYVDGNKISQKTSDNENKKYPIMITKPFFPLLKDVENLLIQAA